MLTLDTGCVVIAGGGGLLGRGLALAAAVPGARGALAVTADVADRARCGGC
jgi:hypothetical protein